MRTDDNGATGFDILPCIGDSAVDEHFVADFVFVGNVNVFTVNIRYIFVKTILGMFGRQFLNTP